MYLTVQKSQTLKGKVRLPSSKSQTIRGLFLALLSAGKSILINALDANDTRAAADALRVLGLHIESKGHNKIIYSSGIPFSITANEIYTGDSGLTTRFILPMLGLRQAFDKPMIVRCGKQMQQRPITPLLHALRKLGMHIKHLKHEGQFPIVVHGPLEGGEVEIDGSASQYSSALLLSLPCAKKDSIIKIQHLHARPYIDMTLAWLDKQSILYQYEQDGQMDIFHIPGRQIYHPMRSCIKGDFSGASCLFVAAALLGENIQFYGLDLEDTQGDKTLLTFLSQMGAMIKFHSSYIEFKGKAPLKGQCIDVKDCPDLIPALAVLATQAQGATTLYNGLQARFKETDRIHSMTQGLRRMGATIVESNDAMTIYPSKLQGAIIDGFDDHRTVMAFAIAGLLANGVTNISSFEAIDKTYPNFVATLQSLGASMGSKDHIDA